MAPSPKQEKTLSCGPCTLCCTYLEIKSEMGFSTLLDTCEDVAKPAGEPCRFLDASGCSVYKSRPLVCRGFACDWLGGKKGFANAEPPYRAGFIGVRGTNVMLPSPDEDVEPPGRGKRRWA